MPSDFSVIAILAAYNEADIIEQVICALIEEGVRVYFIDDGSTDGTVAAVERQLGRGVIGIERRTDTRDETAPAGARRRLVHPPRCGRVSGESLVRFIVERSDQACGCPRLQRD